MDAQLTLRLNQANADNNILTKQLEQLKRDYGELLFNIHEIRDQLADSTHQLQSLQIELASANRNVQASKDECEAKLRDVCNENKMLKKQYHDLSEEMRSFEEKKKNCEAKLSESKAKCEHFEMEVARLNKEKEEIGKKEKDEITKVSAKNAKLERDYNVVMTVVRDKFRVFEKRLSDLERVVDSLNDHSSHSGSQLTDTTPVLQEQESFGLEAKCEDLVGAQCDETTPIVEKTASSMPSPKEENATCIKGQLESFESDTRPAGHVGTEEKSASSLAFTNHKTVPSAFIDLSSSDDDGDKPLPKALKRKLSSHEISYKVEDGDNFSRYRSKDQNDSSLEYINPSKKCVAALKPCEQKFYKWDYEADLLEDLQKDTELCMKGVCVLYRQLLLCTPRETNVAKYLTDGDEKKELKKTLADLEKNSKVADECRRIVLGFSKQLFDIYKNGKDPFFARDIVFSQKTQKTLM